MANPTVEIINLPLGRYRLIREPAPFGDEVSDQVLTMFGLQPSPDLNFGLLTRVHRAVKGLTIQKAAEDIGISRQVLGKIENGSKVPAPVVLKKIARFYGAGMRAGILMLRLATVEDLDKP